jgi:DNA-binding MurR/RpiR family transcriptional regulator
MSIPKSQSLAWRLRQMAAGLSKAERRIARVLLSTNMKHAQDTVASLASRANVSGPTVLRLVGKLGFDSYPSFQAVAQTEFNQRICSPTKQVDQKMRGLEIGAFLAAAHQQFAAGLDAAFDAWAESEIDKVIKLLSDESRTIYVVGGRFTRLFAEYLGGRLFQLRADVRTVGSTSLIISKDEDLVSIGRSSVVVVFDLRRYQTDTIEWARKAADQGSAVILITDTWLSPIADFATVVLPVHIETLWGCDSFAHCAILVELLFGRMLSESGPAALDRMKRIESHQSGMMD